MPLYLPDLGEFIKKDGVCYRRTSLAIWPADAFSADSIHSSCEDCAYEEGVGYFYWDFSSLTRPSWVSVDPIIAGGFGTPTLVSGKETLIDEDSNPVSTTRGFTVGIDNLDSAIAANFISPPDYLNSYIFELSFLAENFYDDLDYGTDNPYRTNIIKSLNSEAPVERKNYKYTGGADPWCNGCANGDPPILPVLATEDTVYKEVYDKSTNKKSIYINDVLVAGPFTPTGIGINHVQFEVSKNPGYSSITNYFTVTLRYVKLIMN